MYKKGVGWGSGYWFCVMNGALDIEFMIDLSAAFSFWLGQPISWSSRYFITPVNQPLLHVMVTGKTTFWSKRYYHLHSFCLIALVISLLPIWLSPYKFPYVFQFGDSLMISIPGLSNNEVSCFLVNLGKL